MEEISSSLLEFLARGQLIAHHRPCPRYRLGTALWEEMVLALGQEKDWALMGLWAEPDEVHAALFDENTKVLAVASHKCLSGSFPSLSDVRPSAIRLERAIQDLVGLKAKGLKDTRRWLDHGQFPISHPLAATSGPAEPTPAIDYVFQKAEGHGIHQIPVGPVHAGIIEPGHFRFHCNGETVIRLEERLGYVHKGVETLMRGKTVDEAAKIVGRISGDSTVAYALAYAKAVESALNVQVSERANVLRGLMAELERIANHLGDVGAICNDAAFAFMLGQCGLLREKVLETSADCFGHRLMMDCVVPGGVAVDLDAKGAQALRDMTAFIRKRFAALVAMYEDKSSLLDRTMTTGKVSSTLVHRFAAGGYVGRASNRAFDTRRDLPYAPYTGLDFEIPLLNSGDVHSRLWVRVREIFASLKLVDHFVSSLPHGLLKAMLSPVAGEGLAVVEAFRGDLLVWVRLGEDGKIARCHPRDASWFQWPLLEASVENNIVADFPLCNKSFNCSYSGQDL